MSKPEELTDEDRAFLAPNVRRYRLIGDITAKALRIIDAHAEDRAALVAQLEAAERNTKHAHECMLQAEKEQDALVAELEAAKAALKESRYEHRHALDETFDVLGRLRAAEAQVTEMTRERDSARRCENELRQQSIRFHRQIGELERRAGTAEAFAKAHDCRASVAESEYDGIHEKLRDAETRVAELTALLAERDAAVREARHERDEAREERDFFDRERQNVVESLSATEAEVTRLTEALAAAKADDQLSRTQRDVLQAEVGRLKEALAAAERWVDVHMARVVKAEDELSVAVGRLEELETALDEPEQQAIAERASSAEARVRELEAENKRIGDACQLRYEQLAAANALLGKFRTHFNAPGTSVFAHAAVRDIDALLRPVDSFTDIHDLEYREAQDAHLAAQPATEPALTEAEQRVLDAVKRAVDAWDANDDGPPSLALQAALETLRSLTPGQTRTDACERGPHRPACREGSGANARTEAEQRVLDACGSVPERVLEDWCCRACGWPRRIAKAELARREAK